MSIYLFYRRRFQDVKIIVGPTNLALQTSFETFTKYTNLKRLPRQEIHMERYYIRETMKLKIYNMIKILSIFMALFL